MALVQQLHSGSGGQFVQRRLLGEARRLSPYAELHNGALLRLYAVIRQKGIRANKLLFCLRFCLGAPVQMR
jgi:hypothetical protein